MAVALTQVLDRGLVFLAAEVGGAEQHLRALVVREQPHELGVVSEHARRVPLHRGFEPEDHVPLALADLAGQRRRPSRRVDELLGGA